MLGISALFLSPCLLSACARREPGTAASALAPPAAAAQLAYVDTSALVALHPAVRQLAELDAEVRSLRAQQPLATPSLTPPEGTRLLVPEAPGTPATPRLHIDSTASDAAIRTDFAARRASSPDAGAEAYERRVDELKRRYTQLRSEPRAAASGMDNSRATHIAEESSRLRDVLASLREQANDRLFYSPAQIRRRRELSRAAEAELTNLQQQQIALLRQSVEPPPHPAPPSVPEAALARAAAERDRRRREAASALDAQEQQELTATHHIDLPAPDMGIPAAPPAELSAEEQSGAREMLANTVRQRGAHAHQGTPDKLREERLHVLRERRAELQQFIREDVQAAAASAARARGLTLVPQRGAAPDRTGELRPLVASLLKSNGSTVASSAVRNHR